MKTIRVGTATLRARPLALIPYCCESVLVALLIVLGVFPSGPAVATASGILPVGVYFDVKQSLVFANDWSWVIAVIFLGVIVRSATFTATLWLAEGGPGPFIVPWARVAGVGAISAILFLPVAGLHFVGVAIRYAPFTWAAGVAGVVVALIVTRRALRVDLGTGARATTGMPTLGSLLGYAYFFSLLAFGISALSASGRWAAALLVVLGGPVHALVAVAWRVAVGEGKDIEEGALVLVATSLAVAGLVGTAAYDRYLTDPSPAGEVLEGPVLYVLGGVDSTSETGALSDLDPRDVGVKRARYLSYRGAGQSYVASDTHRDLSEIAAIVEAQLERDPRPRFLLGHSQSALIVDRLLARSGADAPDREMSISSPPPYPPFWPPRFTIPGPTGEGTGKPAADTARAMSTLVEAVGLQGFDVDAPAAPANLSPVVPCTTRCPIPRLNVWALGDSVWLDRDWKRPGEINIVVISDHVGAIRNARTLDAARDFFAGRKVPSDAGATWQGTLVQVLRFAFEPWRPG